MVMPLIAAGLGAIGAERANRKAIDLSNTAYQRAMADMRKGGLNPILAGKYGGASTPQMQNIMQAGTDAYAKTLTATSGASLQKEQAAQVKMSTEATRLDNMIKELKDIPIAQADYFLKRIKASMANYVGDVINMATEGQTSAFLNEQQRKEVQKVISTAQNTSIQATIALISGVNAAADKGTELYDQLMAMLQPKKKSSIVPTKRKDLFKAVPGDDYPDRMFRLGD